jgi:hypothetical protein
VVLLSTDLDEKMNGFSMLSSLNPKSFIEPVKETKRD